MDPTVTAPLTVLVLEDQATDAELMLYELQRAGVAYQSVVVGTEREFLAQLERPIDVILADYNLPQFDAMRALEALAERGLDIPFIVVSGSVSDEQAIELVRNGASDYLLKDRLGRLPFAVRRALADREAQRRLQEQRWLLVREQAARAMAEAERSRLQQIIDTLPEGVAIADAQGQVVLSNAIAQSIWGQPALPVPLPDYHALEAWRIDETPYQEDELPLVRSVQQGEVVRGEQMLVRNPHTGLRVPILVNSAPLCDTQGRITGGVAIFQDITFLKELEQQREEFLATTSHDLKNPLSVIRGHAQLLLRRLQRQGQVEPAHIAAAGQQIDQTAQRAVGMIQELLDVHRLQMGQSLELRREPVDLLQLVRQVAELQQKTTDRHELQIESSEDQLIGTWDSTRLERVLTNLLANAIKYSPEGGPVRVRLTRLDDQVVLEVEDQGIGIPPAELPQIFEQYYRGSNAAGRFEGSGIGLAGVRQIIEQHGGRIEAGNNAGPGATFSVYLPLRSPEGPP